MAMQHSEATPEDDLEIVKEEVRRSIKRLKTRRHLGSVELCQRC